MLDFDSFELFGVFLLAEEVGVFGDGFGGVWEELLVVGETFEAPGASFLGFLVVFRLNIRFGVKTSLARFLNDLICV